MNRKLVLPAAASAALTLMVAAAVAQDAAPPAAPAPAAEKPAASAPAPVPYTPPAAAPAAPSAATDGGTASVPEAAAAAPEDPAALQAAESLSTAIDDVQIVGPWSDGGKSGVWRTIMMQIPGKSEAYRFFIQKIEKTDAAQAVLATTEIKEIATINGTVVGYRADEPTEGDTMDLTLFFDIVPSDGEIAETYELHFLKDAPYSFGPATN